MSNEEMADLRRLQEERNAAAVKIESLLGTTGIQVGDMLTLTYSNGTSKTGTYNGWVVTEAGSKYVKLDTALVPPAYIVSIGKNA